MKTAPLMEALRSYPTVQQVLVHTGQHYDEGLSQVFFDQLGLPRPDLNLQVGSGSHAEQTARIMLAFEPICMSYEPDLVLVVGDVNSTVACALVASKLGIRVGHVEAGLRSFDNTMPEEINRVLTDRLSHLLFTTEASANENLRREGIATDRIHFVGNVMIDTLLRHRDRAVTLRTHTNLGLPLKPYALVTLHRPSNVDSAGTLTPLVNALEQIARSIPVVFPVHPRTRARLEGFGLMNQLQAVRLLDPLSYLEFLGLMIEAGVVLTDSGGIQEETTVLGVPCLTLRPNTERPVTIQQGTNRLVQLETAAIVAAVLNAVQQRTNGGIEARIPDLWDGKAAHRIARIVVQAL